MKTYKSDSKKKQISILGCGWLGLPLAKELISQDFTVKGSTTRVSKLETLKSNAISPYVLTLNETFISDTIKEFLAESETLIINIPPGLRKSPNKNHVKEIENLIPFIEKSTIQNVLYISSTSVFQDTFSFSVIDDNTIPNATSNSGRQLIEIENLLKANSNFNTTILRFSGLFDEERHPGKLLSGRTNIANPEAPVNLIHKTDCIAIILNLIESGICNEELNASFPEHPSKKPYYQNYCKMYGLELPNFDDIKPSKGKVIDSSKIIKLLDYSYKIGL